MAVTSFTWSNVETMLFWTKFSSKGLGVIQSSINASMPARKTGMTQTAYQQLWRDGLSAIIHFYNQSESNLVNFGEVADWCLVLMIEGYTPRYKHHDINTEFITTLEFQSQ